jgi:hypothetical protein
MPYRKEQAAAVIYKAKDETVSLLVAPNSAASVAGGDEVRPNAGLSFPSR